MLPDQGCGLREGGGNQISRAKKMDGIGNKKKNEENIEANEQEGRSKGMEPYTLQSTSNSSLVEGLRTGGRTSGSSSSDTHTNHWWEATSLALYFREGAWCVHTRSIATPRT